MSEETGKIIKLVFPPKDFKFTAAYNAYSRSYDNAPDADHQALNDAVKALHDDKIGYPQFYDVINRFIEGSDQGKLYRRARIEGTRKQEYNKSEAKKGRNERYRG